MSTCEQCEGRGWGLVENWEQLVIERCGFCDRFENDCAAGEAAWKALNGLLMVAYNTGSLLRDGEYGANSEGQEDGERLVQAAFEAGVNEPDEGRLTLGWGGAP